VRVRVRYRVHTSHMLSHSCSHTIPGEEELECIDGSC
jgi:hypothetical protein